jgi:hypothetical protein
MTSLHSRAETLVPVHSFGAVPLLLFTALSCSSSVEPHSDVTLLVTNGTCMSGRCDSLEILGFPSNQPATPGGFWSVDLGLTTTPQTCITLPDSATFLVIGQHGDGTVDTLTYTWTSASSLALGAQPPSSSRIQASPSTTPFVPTDAAGWSITLPTGSRAMPSSACTP